MSTLDEFILNNFPDAAPLTESDHPEDTHLESAPAPDYPDIDLLKESWAGLNPAERFAIDSLASKGKHDAGHQSSQLMIQLDDKFGLMVQENEEHFHDIHARYDHDFSLMQVMGNLEGISLHLFDEQGHEHRTRTVYLDDLRILESGDDDHPPLTCFCLSPVLKDAEQHKTYESKLVIVWDVNIRTKPHRYWAPKWWSPPADWKPPADKTPEDWAKSFDLPTPLTEGARYVPDSPFRDQLGILLQSLGERYSVESVADLSVLFAEQQLAPDTLREQFSVGKDENAPLELIIARLLNDDWKVTAEDCLLRYWVMSVRPTA